MLWNLIPTKPLFGGHFGEQVKARNLPSTKMYRHTHKQVQYYYFKRSLEPRMPLPGSRDVNLSYKCNLHKQPCLSPPPCLASSMPMSTCLQNYFCLHLFSIGHFYSISLLPIQSKHDINCDPFSTTTDFQLVSLFLSHYRESSTVPSALSPQKLRTHKLSCSMHLIDR